MSKVCLDSGLPNVGIPACGASPIGATVIRIGGYEKHAMATVTCPAVGVGGRIVYGLLRATNGRTHANGRRMIQDLVPGDGFILGAVACGDAAVGGRWLCVDVGCDQAEERR